MTISEGSPMHRRTLLAVLAAMAIVVASFATMASHAAPASAATSGTYFVTLYGWPDNSPPGGAIAYPGLHSTAGGTGTFSDPITFATDRSEIAPGTKVYYSFLKRYFIMEDDCAQCDQDWTGGGADKFHIDLWVGGQGGNTNKVLACEDALTQSGTVVVNPPSTEPVVSGSLFNSSSNTCYRP
jgi:hypothetical protein